MKFPGLIPVPDPTLLTTEALTREISHLKELHNQKFSAIELAMKERDERSIAESELVKSALDTAFAAQKDAAKESNESIKETLNRQRDLVDVMKSSVDLQISDLKVRIAKMESQDIGQQRGRDNWSSYIFGMVGFLGFAVVLVKELTGK